MLIKPDSAVSPAYLMMCLEQDWQHMYHVSVCSFDDNLDLGLLPVESNYFPAATFRLPSRDDDGRKVEYQQCLSLLLNINIAFC